MEQVPVCGSTTQLGYSSTISLSELKYGLNGLGGIRSRIAHPVDKEVQPLLPIAVIADPLKPSVILILVCLEEYREIQKRASEDPPLCQQEGDKQSTDPAVAIYKGMDRFKLTVKQTDLNERWICAPVVCSSFPLVKGPLHLVDRRRHETRITR